MKVLAFFNVKGGVGKTTTATTVAHMLATVYKKRTLLVDLDPQGNSSDLFSKRKLSILELLKLAILSTDLNALSEYKYTVGDLLTNAALNIHEVITHTEYENLDLIPSFLTLAEIEEQMKADIRTPQQFRLKAHLETVKDDYDYCILDCSPSISLVNINGLAVANTVLTPLRCDMWGVIGMCVARNLIRTVKNYNPVLDFGGCFFVQWNNQNSLSKQIRELMVSLLGNKFIDVQIRKTVKVEEMTYQHKALADYAANSTATKDYMRLCEYIIQKF